MSITSIAIRRSVATTMFFLIVIILGFVGFRYLPVDLLPEIENPEVNVSVSYDNVGPEEMENIITDPLENVLSGIPHLEEMSSSSSEGSSSISLEFAQGTNIDAATNNVRDALDRIRDDLPPDADQPRIRQFNPDDFPIVIVGVRSNRDPAELTRILNDEISMHFEQISGVGSIDVWGGIEREVQVELKRERLLSSELTTNDVITALNRDNVTLPGGTIKDGYSDFYVRTDAEYRNLDEIRRTVVTSVDNQPIRIEDVADVRHGYEDISRYVEIDETPTLRLAIQKQSGANTVEVADQINREIDRLNSLRGDMELIAMTDQSEFIQESIDTLRNSAIWGGILAIIVLFGFLRNGSTTFIIATAIPISLVATFGLLYFGGLTLNQMTFGGLALGIGLIVDNAIVVLENIVRKRQNGEERKHSADVGTKEVSGAIIAATLTTSVIFLPVVFMQTTTGTLFQELGLVVVFALLCSLLVALTLVPMLASRYLTIKPHDPETDKQSKTHRFFEQLETRYISLLRRAIHYKWTVAGTALFLVIGSFYMASYIPFELAPDVEPDEVRVSMSMEDGTNIAVINHYFDDLDRIVKETVDPSVLEYYTRDLGGWGGDGRIDMVLADPEERDQSASEIASQLRDRVNNAIPGANIRVQTRGGLWIMRRVFRSGGGDDDAEVDMQLRGYDLATIEGLARNIRNRVEPIEGVTEVEVQESEGRPQQDIRIDRDKLAELGVGINDVASIIQTNIGGSRAGVFRVDGEERPIMVRLQPDDRVSTDDIGNISIRGESGDVVPVSSVIDQQRSRAPTSISRVDGQRVQYITANLEEDVTLGEAVSDMEEVIAGMDLPEGYSVYFGGEYEEIQRAQQDFMLAIILALVLVYMVMAGQFERYLDPLIVMFAVPVAIIGVVPTLLLTGTTFNMQSLMGVLMLLGIVVNNAIVLVDYINLQRRSDKQFTLLEAVVEAARLRLRPILMTTMTTILAMLPLAIGIGTGAEIQAALARVVIGGLLASTLITLFLIPIVYLGTTRLAERLKAYFALQWQLLRKRAANTAEAESG